MIDYTYYLAQSGKEVIKISHWDSIYAQDILKVLNEHGEQYNLNKRNYFYELFLVGNGKD